MKTIFTLILVLAAVAMAVWIMGPLWNDLQALRAEQAQVSAALSKLQDLENLRDELVKTRDSIAQDQLDRLTKLLPPKPDNGSILVSLEKLTKDRGIKLKSVEFSRALLAANQQLVGSAVSAPAYSTVSYTFNISANYDSFRSLLKALENTLRVSDVTDITFSTSPTNIFDFTLKANSYYQK